jgi:hypothetical protein
MINCIERIEYKALDAAGSSLSVHVTVEVVLCVVITGEDMEAVAIDFYVSSNCKVSWRKKISIFVYILVLPSFQELAFHDARVLLGRLENRDRIIRQEERNNKSPVNVFRDSGVESGSVPEDLFVVVHILEEVPLWLVWQEFEHIAQAVHFISKPVMGRNLNRLWLSRSGVLNLPNFEVLLVLIFVEVLGKLVDSLDPKHSAVSLDRATWLNFVASQVIVPNEVLPWLVYGET